MKKAPVIEIAIAIAGADGFLAQRLLGGGALPTHHVLLLSAISFGSVPSRGWRGGVLVGLIGKLQRSRRNS